MLDKPATLEVTWSGPYSWPEFEDKNNLPRIPKTSGVYLQTFEYLDGYMIYAAGLTRRTIPVRFREHTRKFLNGEYTVLDITAVQQGIRKEIWHGWDYTRKHQAEFKERKSVILAAVRKQLLSFCIFVAEVGKEPRICERLEASIMNNLYQQPSPFCDIPDKGMQLAPRWSAEKPIIVKNMCAVSLHGLPLFFEI